MHVFEVGLNNFSCFVGYEYCNCRVHEKKHAYDNKCVSTGNWMKVPIRLDGTESNSLFGGFIWMSLYGCF